MVDRFTETAARELAAKTARVKEALAKEALAKKIYIALCGSKSKDANFKSLAIYALEAAEVFRQEVAVARAAGKQRGE